MLVGQDQCQSGQLVVGGDPFGWWAQPVCWVVGCRCWACYFGSSFHLYLFPFAGYPCWSQLEDASDESEAFLDVPHNPLGDMRRRMRVRHNGGSQHWKENKVSRKTKSKNIAHRPWDQARKAAELSGPDGEYLTARHGLVYGYDDLGCEDVCCVPAVLLLLCCCCCCLGLSCYSAALPEGMATVLSRV